MKKMNLFFLFLLPLTIQSAALNDVKSYEELNPIEAELFAAIQLNDSAKIKELIKNGVDINIMTQIDFDLSDLVEHAKFDTPLHYAIGLNAPLEIIQILLENNANPNDYDEMKMTAFAKYLQNMFSRNEKPEEIIKIFKLFLDKGAILDFNSHVKYIKSHRQFNWFNFLNDWAKQNPQYNEKEIKIAQGVIDAINYEKEAPKVILDGLKNYLHNDLINIIKGYFTPANFA